MATIIKRKWKTSKGVPREAWTLAYTDAAGKRHKQQFAKKREADARRVEVEGQVAKGTFRAEAATTTVDDAVALYIKNLEGRHARGEHVTALYLKTTKAHLRNYVAPDDSQNVDFDGGIGKIKLAQLTARSVSEFRDKLRDAEISVATTRQILGSLSRTLRHAVLNDLIAVNVAAGIRVIGKRDEGSRKIVPPAKGTLTKILKAAKENKAAEPDAKNFSLEAVERFKRRRAAQVDDLHLRIQFAAATGLRASEQWALKWRHVDLKGGFVTVETRVDAFGDFDTTKSEAGTRIVPLGMPILDALREWKMASSFSGDNDFVFPDSFGGFTRHTNFMRRRWKPLLVELKVTKVGWHSLRHFAISTWIEAGMAPKTVQTFAGHSTLAVTMDRYGHLFPSDDHKATMDKIAASVFADGA